MKKAMLTLLINLLTISALHCIEIVNDILNDKSEISLLKTRLEKVNAEFHLKFNKKLHYKFATTKLHGPIRKFSKEQLIYYSNPYNDEVNCEHIVPKSFFGHQPKIASDLHNMFSSYKSINLLRGTLRFAEISEDNAEFILIKHACNSLKDAKEKDKHLCKISKNNKEFEPDNASKGKIARACAYFFTRYPGFLPIMSDVIDMNTMIKWHEKFPPDETEIKREKAVFWVQRNHNPYIIQPIEWMRTVWLGQ